VSTTIYELRGTVALITMDNPPSTGWVSICGTTSWKGCPRRSRCEREAVVLIGSARAFSGGRYPGVRLAQGFREPSLNGDPHAGKCRETRRRGISGACMGGGLELALGCHYRVAVKGARSPCPK